MTTARPQDPELPHQDRLALVVLGLGQSLVLLLLHKALSHAVWPATDARWLYALYAVAIGVLVFLYAGAVRWRDRANGHAAAVIAVLLFVGGWQVGWLEAPYYTRVMGDSDYAAPLFLSMAVALFIAGVYFRSWREAGRLDYARLLDNSWRNALTAAFTVGFLAVFALLLVLWASLFKVIKIDFFAELFTKAEFVYPIAGLVGGWGLGLVRARVGLVATVRHLCEVLIRALLPLVALIVVIFLATLPVTGLAPLWDTGYAAVLLIALAAVLLFFFNAMVADDEAISLHPWLRPLVLAALVLVPINAGLAAWSLGLRVEQYGWTVDRLWAVFVIGWVGLFSLGYAAIVLYRRGMDIGWLRRLNIVLGLLLALDLVVVNTPLFDFHRVAAKSQVERLVEGKVPLAGFDARYLRFELGPYGIAQLEALKTSKFAAENPEAVEVADAALAAKTRWRVEEYLPQSDLVQLRARLVALPGTTVEDAFLLELGRNISGELNLFFCFRGEPVCVIGEFEHHGQRYRALGTAVRMAEGHVWRHDAGGWERIGGLREFGCPERSDGGIDPSQPFTPMESEYFLLRNGECLYQVLPERAAL